VAAATKYKTGDNLNSEEDSVQPPHTPRKPRNGKQKVVIQLDSDSEEDIV
jgi:hypothetical protein